MHKEVRKKQARPVPCKQQSKATHPCKAVIFINELPRVGFKPTTLRTRDKTSTSMYRETDWEEGYRVASQLILHRPLNSLGTRLASYLILTFLFPFLTCCLRRKTSSLVVRGEGEEERGLVGGETAQGTESIKLPDQTKRTFCGPV